MTEYDPNHKPTVSDKLKESAEPKYEEKEKVIQLTEEEAQLETVKKHEDNFFDEDDIIEEVEWD